MSNLTATTTFILSVFTLLGQAGILILIAVACLPKKFASIEKIISEKGLGLAFMLTLLSTAGSLFYSNIAGFAPCVLCWYQRIFLFPQTVVLGVNWQKKDGDTGIISSVILSIAGALIALYHYYIQFGGSPLIPCGAGSEISCAVRYFVEFGYITMPVMSFTVFTLIALILILQNKFSRIYGK